MPTTSDVSARTSAVRFREHFFLHHEESVESISNSPFHDRLSSLINVYMRMLLCTALLPAPCACAAAVRSSIAIFTTVADLNAVRFLLQKKEMLFSNFSHKTQFSIIWSGFFQKAGIFRSCPLFLDVKAVCQGIALTLSRGESAVSRHLFS